MKNKSEKVSTLPPDELPHDWEFATIGELIANEGVFTDGDWVVSANQDINGEVRLIQLADIGDGWFIDKSERFLTYEKAIELGCTFLKKNDVLIARMPDPLGRACIFPGTEKNAVTVVDICIVRPNCKDIENKWLMYFVNAPNFRAVVSSLQSGSTRKRISRKNLARIALPIPPSNEQKRIVAEIEKQFSRLDEAVENLQRVKANLKRYKASVLKAAVEGKLTEQWRAEHPDVEPASQLLERILKERREKWEENELAKMKAKGKVPKDNKWKKKYREPAAVLVSKLPSLPDNWTWATPEQLSSLADHSLAIGPFGSNLKVVDYKSTGVPLIFVRNVRTGIFDDESTKFVNQKKAKELHAHKVESGDVLITKMGDPPGDAYLYPPNRPAAIITADCIKWTLSPLLNTPEYFVHAVNSQIVKNQIISITKGVAQQKVSLSRFKTIAIPLPTIDEIIILAESLDKKLSTLCWLEAEVQNKLSRSDKLRQSILKMAFSGKLVPQDRLDEPSTELLNRITIKKLTHTKGPKKKRRIKVQSDKNKKQRAILDILRELDSFISTADLIDKAGYPKNANPEAIEPFYLELKRTIEENEIEVKRKGEYDFFKMKR